MQYCSIRFERANLIFGFLFAGNMRTCQKLSYDRAPLRQLLEAAVTAYVNTTHSRYEHPLDLTSIFMFWFIEQPYSITFVYNFSS